MATKIVMEALSPTMEEGRLVKWVKNEGDAVKTGDTLAEVETDKAVMELVARGDGVLRKQVLAAGATAPVGQLVGIIAAADENIDALAGGAAGGAPAPSAKPAQPAKSSAPSAQAPAAGKQPAAAPAAQASAASGKQGAAAKKPSAPANAQSEAPAQDEVAAGAAAPSESADENQGDAPATPAPSADAEPKDSKATAVVADKSRQPETEHAEQPASSDDAGGRPRSSPLARRLASERGLDLTQMQGSGPNGRIIKRDIEAAATNATAAKGPAADATSANAPAAAARVAPARASSDADFEDVALSPMRKAIAKRLAESIGPVPTFYLTTEISVDRVAEMRTAMAELGDDYKASFNDIIMKAVATALAQHPECNAHWLGDRIRYFNRVHLGMAVAIPDGLITPVIFDADRKPMREIAAEARDLAKRARDRKLKPDQYTGSTFSVSNLGMFGIDEFTAIINPPEAGILAVGAVEEKAAVVNGELRIGRRMRVTMSCDHRVIDGATGAKFLQTLRRMIENPLMLVF